MKWLSIFLCWMPVMVKAQFVKQSSFEVLPINTGLQVVEGSRSYSVTQSKAYARLNAASARFELRASDPQAQYGNKRAEITVINNTSSPNTSLRWYRFSTYQRSADWKPDTREEIFPFQFHDKSSSCSASPNLAMEVINNKYRVKVRYSVGNYCTSSNRREISRELVAVPFDRWNDWVIYYDPRTDANGRIRIWLNGKEIYSYTGPSMYIGSQFPYLKIGIYKWVWMNSVPSGLPTVRVGYIDALAIADASKNYTTVALTSTQ